MTGRAPLCSRCHHRHLVVLPCWNGRHVARVAAAVLAEWGDVCVHCGLPGARSVEHVQPRSWGGLDTLANCRPAHLRCNLSRGVKPMTGWAQPTRSRTW